MTKLTDFLSKQGYQKIKLKKINTNHFEIKAKVNKVKGNFILDTGASNSCVGFDMIENLSLDAEPTDQKASGAGSTNLETKLAKNNVVQIGKYKQPKVNLVLIDLSHINEALISQNADPVTGIIGADILFKGKAIIDYDKKYLYLKNKTEKNK
ncbi:retropepsin-like aspartic protease [Namhaeicola litoreus]|uniref:Retropepsin-like aspartic protease n=1 Tax=Namhaeicola litoreus TaxID=1052145 RepID=A0ABW3XWM5_9FLAO